MVFSIKTDPAKWGAQLERSLQLGFAEPELANSIDEILVWFSSVESNDSGDEFGEKLISLYGLDEFRALFENCIDRLIISNDSRDMFMSCDTRDHAKWRYRKLMGIFHPDKGSNNQAWLNFRAEQINKAYRKFEINPSVKLTKKRVVKKRARKNVRSSSSFEPHSEFSIIRRKQTPARRLVNWRKVFGDPAELERKVIQSLVLIFVIILILVSLAAYLD